MRWKAISEAKDLPNEEYYEEPPVHILRGKIDDPRAGWQVVQCTVVDMLDVAKQFDYAEYLDESPSSDPAEVLVKALETALYYHVLSPDLDALFRTALSQHEQLKQQ